MKRRTKRTLVSLWARLKAKTPLIISHGEFKKRTKESGLSVEESVVARFRYEDEIALELSSSVYELRMRLVVTIVESLGKVQRRNFATDVVCDLRYCQTNLI